MPGQGHRVYLGPNCRFPKGSYTVADFVLREYTQTADAHDGSEQAHIPAKIRYTTSQGTIGATGRPYRKSLPPCRWSGPQSRSRKGAGG